MRKTPPIAPNAPTPPSADVTKRTSEWHTDVSIACYYLYGRMDMGERRDTNDNYKFAEAWADAKWYFRGQWRYRLPTLQGAIEAWDRKEPF